MTVEIPAWAALAVAVLIAVDVLSWALLRRERARRREAERRLERLSQRRSRMGPVVATAVVQPESVAMPVTLVQRKVSGSEAERAPRGEGVTLDDHDAAVATARAELAAVEAEVGARAAQLEAATVVDRVLAADKYRDQALATDPIREPGELDRFQPLVAIAQHAEEWRPKPPPIQPEPVVAVAEVLEPVEVPDGDDEPPQDETRVTARRDDEPPTGGRALTPFGLDGRPLDMPGRRHQLGPVQPQHHLPVVLPTGYLPAGWVRTLHRTVLTSLKDPIRIDRRYSVLASTVRRLRVELMAWLESWPGEPGIHRRSGYIGGHRGLA